MPRRAKLRDIIALLEHIYAGPIGAEFAHVSETDERLWLQDEFQVGRALQNVHAPTNARTSCWQLTAAEGLERYLHTRYVGQKRFSLEGGEALIPMLDDLIQRGGASGHRGNRHRHGASRPPERAGQHARQVAARAVLRVRRQVRRQPRCRARATSSTTRASRPTCSTPGGNVHVALAFNPSHLEIVEPGGRRFGARAPGASRRRHGRAACCRC